MDASIMAMDMMVIRMMMMMAEALSRAVVALYFFIDDSAVHMLAPTPGEWQANCFGSVPSGLSESTNHESPLLAHPAHGAQVVQNMGSECVAGKCRLDTACLMVNQVAGFAQ